MSEETNVWMHVDNEVEGWNEVQVVTTAWNVEIWTTHTTAGRVVATVSPEDAYRLADQLVTAVYRYDAMKLERGEVVVEPDPESGVLTASLGWCRLRRAIPGEPFGEGSPSKSARGGLTRFVAPRVPERDWHEARIDHWIIWQREGYLRLLDALVEAERARTAAIA
ncbi:MAG: hypothetical protein LCI03_09020 [Actinobacteria bacterium]|nr:hypothetical protein [Actinomycetota bacterium]